MTSLLRPLYAILGFPVGHSRSPAMHEAGFRALGIDARYVAFEVPPSMLRDAVRGIRALGIAGGNVTLPHKTAIAAMLDEVDDDARAMGAVNTFMRDGERLFGFNTDAAGLIASLREEAIELTGARALLLGAGGAARAAVIGLSHAGAERIVIAARSPERAEQLIVDLKGSLAGTDARVIALDAMSTVAPDTTLVIQATSAPLRGDEPAAALTRAIPFHLLPENAVTVDLVYEPRETLVMKAARARGLRALGGLGMLVHQGALAFERFTGEAAPLDVLRRAASAAGPV